MSSRTANGGRYQQTRSPDVTIQEQAADLIPLRARPLTKFNPVQTRERVSVLSAASDHANRIRDWTALREAVRIPAAKTLST
jgi:hypothetical protein